MNIQDINVAACGLNEDGSSMSTISLAYKILNVDGSLLKTQNELFSDRANISFERVEGIIKVLLKFSSPLDYDLRILWNIINAYNSAAKKYIQTDIAIPILSLTVVPKSLNGRFFISAISPMFCCLQANNLGAQVDTICLFFDAQSFEYYETDEIDEKQIQSEVDREKLEQERIEAIDEQKKIEREEFLRNREASLKNMWHNS